MNNYSFYIEKKKIINYNKNIIERVRDMKKHNKGFTLVELLAVIVILALILIISIPSILETANKAKKETFYQYAQSLQSKAIAKYTQDMDDNTVNNDCNVYDISTDLDIKNTGDFEGWVKVNRRAINDSKKKSATVSLSSSKTIEYVRYCIAQGSTCTPDTSYSFPEGAKTITITQTIGENQTMCALYQYGENGKLVNSAKKCQSYGAAANIVTDYDYDVIVTMKSRDFGVENVNLNDENQATKTAFYKSIDKFKEKSKTIKVNPMAIASPTCKAGDPVTYKGTTTTKTTRVNKNTTTTVNRNCPAVPDSAKNFNIVLNANSGEFAPNINNVINQCVGCQANTTIPSPTKRGYVFDGWYYDKAFNKQLSGNQSNRVEKVEKKDTAGCVIGYENVYLYAKWRLNESATSTSTTQTYIHDNTTADTRETYTYTGNNTSTSTQTYTHQTTPPTTNPTYSHETNTSTTRGTYTQETTTANEQITTDYTTTTKPVDLTDDTILLENLSVDGYALPFISIRFSYEINVPNSQTSIGVHAVARTPDVTSVEITGNTDLKVGDNVVLIKLKNATTEKENTYRIVVSRLDVQGNKVTLATKPVEPDWDPDSGLPDPSLDESNAQLRLLTASGYSFAFDPNTYEYDLTVFTLDDLLLSIEPMAKAALTSVNGNENLQDGSVVEIDVISPNGYYKKTYKITIRYSRKTSARTKYLRNIAIVLGVILVMSLIIIRANKHQKLSVIKKKNKSENAENDQKDNIV